MTTRTDHNIGTPTGKAARPWHALALAGAALLSLSGCGESTGFIAGCPNLGIVRDGALVKQAGGDALLANIQGDCSYSDTGVTVDAILTITANGTGSSVPVQYFVAVTDPQRNVLSKQVFNSAVPLNNGTGMVRERFQQVIPAPKTMDARWYEVLVSFQLDTTQLDANRAMNEKR
ncbi:hypothetical protein [Oleisolibacter albus]|uniref:hypothetical protein n=1 Tax=Oleisolibacter albus TaxID=2171757 RepID=UPI000DF207A5|nr:hypothetical protein [Oleisolibacter albus]